MKVLDPLKTCNYYKGEKECPFPLTSVEATYWDIEETWVKLVNPNEGRSDALVLEYIMDFDPDQFRFADIPLSLKAVLYDQYYHFYGSKNGFDNFIKTYYKRSNSHKGDTF